GDRLPRDLHPFPTRRSSDLVVVEAARDLARQSVRYAEVTFSPGTHAWLGVRQDVWLSGLARGRERARREHGVELAWVFDVVRGVDRKSTRLYSSHLVISDAV